MAAQDQSVTLSSKAVWHLLRKLPTAQQRINARKKLVEMSLAQLDAEIAKEKDVLREMRSESEAAKRTTYTRISNLEQQKQIVINEFGFER